MPIGIGKREQLGGKEDSRCLKSSGWIADIHSKFSYPSEYKLGILVATCMLQPAAVKIK